MASARHGGSIPHADAVGAGTAESRLSNTTASASKSPLSFRPTPAGTPPLLIACLCARWCRLCDEYRAVFDAAAAADRCGASWRWIDIEDDAELLGPVDVEDFPTVLIARGADVSFFGPITPQPATLARLVDRASAGALGHVGEPDVGALARRIGAAPANAEAALRCEP